MSWSSRCRKSRCFDGTFWDPQQDGRLPQFIYRQFGLTIRLFFPKNMVNVKFVSKYIKTKMPLNSLLTVVVWLIFKLSTLKSFQIKQLTLCISKNIKLIYENKNKHDQLLAWLSYWWVPNPNPTRCPGVCTNFGAWPLLDKQTVSMVELNITLELSLRAVMSFCRWDIEKASCLKI